MIKPITAWHRWSTKKKCWQYNHFQYGINEKLKPTPESDRQQVWNDWQWTKQYGYYHKALGRTRLVTETELFAQDST